MLKISHIKLTHQIMIKKTRKIPLTTRKNEKRIRLMKDGRGSKINKLQQ